MEPRLAEMQLLVRRLQHTHTYRAYLSAMLAVFASGNGVKVRELTCYLFVIVADAVLLLVLHLVRHTRLLRVAQLRIGQHKVMRQPLLSITITSPYNITCTVHATTRHRHNFNNY